jgi:acid phosphatase
MPYLTSLANSGGSATNYYAIGHFSADNYIAMTSGTTCCFDDSFQDLSATPSIFSQLGGAAQTLAERGGGGYAQRHDPGAYYGFTSLGFTDGQAVDLTGEKFTFVVPGLCDDMHDCGPRVGDAWLSRNVPSFTANPGTAVFITFDEDSGSGQGLTSPPDNRVPMIVVSPSTHGIVDGTQFNHYSLLRTVEDLLGLPALGSAASAASMVGHFGLVAG